MIILYINTAILYDVRLKEDVACFFCFVLYCKD